MIFTSFKFLVFFVIVFLIYLEIPKKYKWIGILFANIVFYSFACSNIMYFLYIVLASIITYTAGILIDRKNNLENDLKLDVYKTTYSNEALEEYKLEENKILKSKKVILIVSIIATLSMLIISKYTNFFLSTINSILNVFNLGLEFKSLDLLLPLGISFYTFMSIGYVIDIYRKEYTPETNFFKYFTFISYFPHIMQGPIDKINVLKEDILNPKDFNYEEAVKNIYRIVLGIIKKIVIADKLAVVLTTVTSNVDSFYGINIFLTMVIYAIELYADFSGYMDIAIGVSGMLGIKIAENFNAPYLSKNMPEFWRRWHMSLNNWFVKYIYIPLGGNRRGNKIKLRNVFIIFFISGLWHGANLSYVTWGIYHGIIMCISNIIKPQVNKFNEKYANIIKSRIYKLFQIIRTFIIVCFGYFFLSIENVNVSLNMFKNMFLFWKHGNTIREITTTDCKVTLIIAIIMLVTLDILKEKKIDIYDKVRKLPIICRWLIYILGMFMIILLNSGTAQEFLYFKF